MDDEALRGEPERERDRDHHRGHEEEGRQPRAAAHPVPQAHEKRPGREREHSGEEDRPQERPQDQEAAHDEERRGGEARELLEAGVGRRGQGGAGAESPILADPGFDTKR
jgi:hypothetical protein